MRKKGVKIFLVVCFLFSPFLCALYSEQILRIPVFQMNLEKQDKGSFLPDRLKPRKNSLKEFMGRIQFVTLDKLTESLCDVNIQNLRLNTGFISKYRIQSKEDAVFYAGDFYYRHWTPVAFSGPHSGCAIVDHALGSSSGKRQPLGHMSTAFKTVYSAEQHFKNYLKKFPDGAYVLPALFGIAKCRVFQHDYAEAYSTYKYALQSELEKYDVNDAEATAKSIAGELLKINRNFCEDFDVVLTVVNDPGCHENIRSKVFYKNKKAIITIKITC
jgi:hypothetical protein